MLPSDAVLSPIALIALLTSYTQDVHLVLKLLLPLYKKRVYNMKDKQLAKALSAIFHCRSLFFFPLLFPSLLNLIGHEHHHNDHYHYTTLTSSSLDDIMLDLEQGDCAETAVKFFHSNTRYPPQQVSSITMAQVLRVLTFTHCLHVHTVLGMYASE